MAWPLSRGAEKMEEKNPTEVGLTPDEPALSVWINMFRWMASMAVLTSHIRHRLFESYATTRGDEHSPLFYIVGGASSFGHPAVLIFFILSGFLVGGSSLRRFRKGNGFDLLDYSTARLSRLWTVLIPALFVTLILNMIGIYVFNGITNGIYDVSVFEGNYNLVHDPLNFVCNAAFLQTAVCDQYGLNGALWSLFNEFWYYAAWPLIMIAFWSPRSLGERVVLVAIPMAVLSLLASIQFAGPNVALYFTIWLTGVLAADRARPFLPMHPLLAAATLVIGLLVWRIFTRNELWGTSLLTFPIDFGIGLLFANMLMCMKSYAKLPFPPLKRLHGFMAGFSFTVFGIHTPIIHFICALCMALFGFGWKMAPVGATPYLLFFATIVIVQVSAFILSLGTERQMPALRQFIQNHIVSRKYALR